MAKFELKFIDLLNNKDSIKAELSCASNEGNTIDVISITGMFESELFNIVLDKSTAIKFAKTLRTEINKITEIENKTNYVDLFKDKIEYVVEVKKGVYND
jgi:hypothetical protein